jgi:two-component system, LytTR family, response regulator
MTGTILIADDEPLARRTLRAHLRDLGCSGPIYDAADGKTAIALAKRERPDLIFLDIVMPGATGLQVLEQLEHEAKVIFTTAHEQYAVTAFELGALDYLMKPFGRDRLERVIQRVRTASDRSAAPLLTRAQETLHPTRMLSRIFVRDGTRILPIDLGSIERVQGADDYVTIVTATKQYLVSVRLSDLESHLVRANFMRIHRSHVVNLEYIQAIEPHDAARLRVVMKSGAEIVASRAGTKQLRDLAL